jgi:hypothetical protein
VIGPHWVLGMTTEAAVQTMIPKSGHRFSEDIMLHQKCRADRDSKKRDPALESRCLQYLFRGLANDSDTSADEHDLRALKPDIIA